MRGIIRILQLLSHMDSPISYTCVLKSRANLRSQLILYHGHLTDILRGAPRLVALQIDEVDAPGAIQIIRTHIEEELDGGVTRERFRLILITR